MRLWQTLTLAGQSVTRSCPAKTTPGAQSRTPLPKRQPALHSSRSRRKSSHARRPALARQHWRFPARHRLRVLSRSPQPILLPFVSSFASRKTVHRGVAAWAGIPPPMDPNPLVRIFPNNALQDARKILRILEDIAFRVTRSNELHRGLEAQAIPA